MKRVGNITKVDQISILLSFLSKVLEVLLLILVKSFPVKTGNHLFAWWQRKEEACTLEVISCWCLSDRQLRVKHRLWGLRIASLAEVYTNNVAVHQHFSNSLTDVDSFRLLAVRIVWE